MNDAKETSPRKLAHWAPLLIVALSFAIVGCYTILKHPVTEQEGPQGDQSEYSDGSPHPQEYYRQNCIECHSDYSEFPYGYFYGDYPDYYFEYPRWGYYYAYPWWWDRHWYETGSGDGEGEQVVDGQKAPRRGGLIPPYVTGSPAINTGGNYGGGGYVAPGSTSGGKPGTGGSTGAGGEQGQKTRVRVGSTDSTQTPNSDTKETKSTKATRRGGTKP
jgi:hypothetical protein